MISFDFRWLIYAGVFFGYLATNFQFDGPTYLHDEIGYLTKAAFFCGKVVDCAGSYHAGYSLLLAPLFLLSNPFVIWKGVLVLNALSWAVSFFLLSRVLRIIVPDLSLKKEFLVLFITALYPGFVGVTGYAFPHTFFALIYLSSLIALLKAKTNKAVSFLPFSCCVGFLYWIHPTGLAVIAASVLVLGWLAISQRRLSIIVWHLFFVVTLTLIYREWLHPWINMAMTTEGFSIQTHYPTKAEIMNRMLSRDFWPHFVGLLSGQFSFFIISTMGVAAYALFDFLKETGGFLRQGHRPENKAYRPSSGTMVYMAFSMIGIMILSSLLFAINQREALDIYLHGRYIDPILLPFFAIGLLSMYKFARSQVLVFGHIPYMREKTFYWFGYCWEHAVLFSYVLYRFE